jgi:hypothetical protein
VHLGNQLREIVRPRNEKTHGSGISHIRFAPDLTGKGHNSEGGQYASSLLGNAL